jgi:hypothetical protein
MDTLTQKELKESLHYEPKTGVFTWLASRGNSVKVGDIAGYIDKLGYRFIKINGKMYKAHRLVFLYMTGKFPPDEIDHLNHLRYDNRFVNLRHATRVENSRNRSMNSNNTSGFNGVYWHEGASKWRVRIRVNGKDKHLGLFTDMDDAIIARKKANVENEFHANHGAVA